jgi:hypothetical protein
MFFFVKAVTVYGPAFGYKIPGLFLFIWQWFGLEFGKSGGSIYSVDEYRLAGVQEKLDLV